MGSSQSAWQRLPEAPIGKATGLGKPLYGMLVHKQDVKSWHHCGFAAKRRIMGTRRESKTQVSTLICLSLIQLLGVQSTEVYCHKQPMGQSNALGGTESLPATERASLWTCHATHATQLSFFFCSGPLHLRGFQGCLRGLRDVGQVSTRRIVKQSKESEKSENIFACSQ